MAFDAKFESVLRIDFGQGGHFSSPVLITQPDKFEPPPQMPPLEAPMMPPSTSMMPPILQSTPSPPVIRGAPSIGPILSEPPRGYPPPLLFPPPPVAPRVAGPPPPVPPLQPPLGPPPPGPPPPEVLSNLPPELINILRHIPPPLIQPPPTQNPPQNFAPRFPASTSPPRPSPKFDKFEPFR